MEKATLFLQHECTLGAVIVVKQYYHNFGFTQHGYSVKKWLIIVIKLLLTTFK